MKIIENEHQEIFERDSKKSNKTKKQKSMINVEKTKTKTKKNILEESEQCENIIDPVKFFTIKELCYYKQINRYFKSCSNDQIDTMIDIIKSGSKNRSVSKSKISLRVLDWFVTKYSKKMDTASENSVEIFDVRISYKSQLKSFKKRYFDPFRRRKTFTYFFPGTYKQITTTLGQLNFFKWAFLNNVLIFVKNNLININKEMTKANKEAKEKKRNSEENSSELNDKKKNKKEKTKGVRVRASKHIEDEDVKIVLKFD